MVYCNWIGFICFVSVCIMSLKIETTSMRRLYGDVRCERDNHFQWCHRCMFATLIPSVASFRFVSLEWHAGTHFATVVADTCSCVCVWVPHAYSIDTSLCDRFRERDNIRESAVRSCTRSVAVTIVGVVLLVYLYTPVWPLKKNTLPSSLTKITFISLFYSIQFNVWILFPCRFWMMYQTVHSKNARVPPMISAYCTASNIFRMMINWFLISCCIASFNSIP